MNNKFNFAGDFEPVTTHAEYVEFNINENILDEFSWDELYERLCPSLPTVTLETIQ
jgi:hypothetical protein